MRYRGPVFYHFVRSNQGTRRGHQCPMDTFLFKSDTDFIKVFFEMTETLSLSYVLLF